MYLKAKRAFFSLLVMALSWLSPLGRAADLDAQLLVYRVSEPGAAPYISRILVTERYLRMDQGRADDGFILYDRRQQIIYSVNSADRTILQISPIQSERPLPDGMKQRAEPVDDQALPELKGGETEYWRFFVNDELCRSAIVAPELMPGATRAYAEYLDLLAAQHYSTLQAIPPELQDACEQTVHVFTPLAVLDKGLVVREWGEAGGLQELLDYRERFEVPADSFSLPEGFQRTRLGELQANP